MKKIQLTEAQLHRIIKESVNRAIDEAQKYKDVKEYLKDDDVSDADKQTAKRKHDNRYMNKLQHKDWLEYKQNEFPKIDKGKNLGHATALDAKKCTIRATLSKGWK